MRALAFFSVLLLFSVNAKSGVGDAWEVLATGLPERVFTGGARGNITFYILKQTHEPVFRRGDGQNYTSKLLKTWSRSPDYRNFTFCPVKDLKFDELNPFDIAQFKVHLSSVTAKYDPDFRSQETGGCVNISFKTRRKGYLDYLTLYENAPTRSVSDIVEVGLGPFSVESVSKDKIVLSRKEKIRGGYDRIILHEYSGPKDPNLENRAIKDFNIIPSGDVPEWVKDGYTSFKNVELKSINLIINHPDFKVRRRAYNCINIAGLRSAFFAGKKDFFDISTILPMGISGAAPGLPVQACDKGGKINAELRFANWMYGNSDAMGKYAEDFRKKSGITMRLSEYSPQALVSVLNKAPRPFDLVILVFDAVRPDPSAFFESFSKQDGFHDFETPEITSLYHKLLYEEDDLRKEKISKELTSVISRQALALPLYQNIRTIYYPKEINNLTVGRGFLEYPEVAEFRK